MVACGSRTATFVGLGTKTRKTGQYKNITMTKSSKNTTISKNGAHRTGDTGAQKLGMWEGVQGTRESLTGCRVQGRV